MRGGEYNVQQSIYIKSRFNGPPSSANGGYASGMLASALRGAVEASLHAPPPLDKELELIAADGKAELKLGDQLLGTAIEKPLELDVPALPPQFELGINPYEAPDAPGEFKPFGRCFVCGEDRERGDGMCIHSKRLNETPGLVGAYWDLGAELAGEDGFIKPEYLWSALDCPGYYSCAPGEPALLGRLHAEILAPLKAEGQARIIGWDMGDPTKPKGRKRLCGTAVYSADGTLVAKAAGLWITVTAEYIQAVEASV